MEDKNELIEVHVVNFPNGTTHWFNTNNPNEYLQEIVDKFWKNNPQYKETGVDMVVGSLRMLRKDYQSIQADISM